MKPEGQAPTHSVNSPARGYILVALAAGMWGTLAPFFKVLHDNYRFSALTIAFLRAGMAAAILVVMVAVLRPKLLRISRRVTAFHIIYGLVGVSAFYFCYVQAVVQTNVTTAVVLLYTAPAFVTVIAWRLWKEPLTFRKLGALALAFAGCTLVARAYDPAQFIVNAPGVALGLLAAITYALYTVLSKFVLSRESNWTALAYALGFGALFLAPFQTTEDLTPLLGGIVPWLLLIAVAIGPTLASLALYNTGLQSIPASNASLVAMLEPVVASALAFALLGEKLEVPQLIGGAMVIGGAVLIRI